MVAARAAGVGIVNIGGRATDAGGGDADGVEAGRVAGLAASVGVDGGGTFLATGLAVPGPRGGGGIWAAFPPMLIFSGIFGPTGEAVEATFWLSSIVLRADGAAGVLIARDLGAAGASAGLGWFEPWAGAVLPGPDHHFNATALPISTVNSPITNGNRRWRVRRYMWLLELLGRVIWLGSMAFDFGCAMVIEDLMETGKAAGRDEFIAPSDRKSVKNVCKRSPTASASAGR